MCVFTYIYISSNVQISMQTTDTLVFFSCEYFALSDSKLSEEFQYIADEQLPALLLCTIQDQTEEN